MIVVADTTPINYLVLTGHDGLLPKLFGQVLIPREVLRELRAEATPHAVREWIKSPPDWVEIRATTKPARRDSISSRRR